MTDPFHELYEPNRPVAPDPVFARRLRARIERALALPKGVLPVSTTGTADSRPGARPGEPASPRPAAVPYLAVADARAAIDWYVDIFDARLADEPIQMPDGRIGHCDVEIAGGHLYLADEHPEIGVTAPRPGESTVSLMLPVVDADAVRERAMAAGATGDRAPYNAYGQRNAWIVDPFGHRWGLTSALPATAPVASRHGEIVHVALRTPDVERTRSFYAAVLGWSYLPDGRVDGLVPSIGFREGASQVTCDFAVIDLAAALDRLRAAGGEAGEIERHPWGTVAECLDDQGTALRLHEAPADADDTPPPATGRRAGGASYLTLEVVDSARARAFYGAVLDWRFAPGRVEDGWQVQDTAPMTGLSGGNERATAVPVWTVPDVAAAVAAVRRHGGSASEPHHEPYGTVSECVDDQGLRFGLVEV
ncbi:MAG: VOC family protein [Jatrophihabitantaceae bacterium]